MIVIIDYGMGNNGSILNMLKKIGAESVVSSEINVIEAAEKIILPGVGTFDNGMNNLENLELVPILDYKIRQQNIPIMGICLGMQLLTNKSEEGALCGLGWIDAETKRFKFDFDQHDLKVPHMGWNLVNIQKESNLFKGMYPEPRFYFVHSYHVVCHDNSDILSKTHHGYDFVSAIEHKNIIGVQFHPEKSHKFGMRLLKNFAEDF